MVTEAELALKVHEFLQSSDLKKTTNNIVFKKLEADFGVNLSDKKPFLRHQVDRFLQSQYPVSDDDDDDDKLVLEGHGYDVVSDDADDDDDDDVGYYDAVPLFNKLKSVGKLDRHVPQNKEKTKRVCLSGKYCTLSPELQKFLGVPHMTRTEVVKQLWTYVKDKSLQDPDDGTTIICDETLRDLLGVDSITILQINKALTKHIIPRVKPLKGDKLWKEEKEEDVKPLKGDKLKKQRKEDEVKSLSKDKQRKQGREADMCGDETQEKRQRKVLSGFLAPLPLSDTLIRFLGTGETALTRPEVIKRVWKYIKNNRLQGLSRLITIPSKHLGTNRTIAIWEGSVMREVITIQVGGFANFIGSHFWNFQFLYRVRWMGIRLDLYNNDELLGLVGEHDTDPVFKNHGLNMDVLYRSGETQEGALTYTPRLVSVNYQGTLGSMSSGGTLYNQIPDLPPSVSTWRGSLSVQHSQRQRRNLFLQRLYDEEKIQPSGVENGHAGSQDDNQDKNIVQSLENDVHFWTDFSKVHYHPQSIYEVNGLWMDGQEFNNYGAGKDVFSEGFRGEEMNERLRFFLEECDHIQGIQFLVDDSGGFSSVAENFLQNIADEYANTPVMLYTVRDPRSHMCSTSRKRNISRDLHDAVSFAKLSPLCKLIVPVGLPSLGTISSYLRVNDAKPYHCSAVYAAALHSLSLPFRMDLSGPASTSSSTYGALDFNEIVQTLSGQNRQNMVAILDTTIPAPYLTGKPSEEPILGNLQSLTPEVSEGAEDVHSVETLVINGALQSEGHRASVSEVQQAISAAYGQAVLRPRFCHLSVATCPLPIPLPFPTIFSDTVSQSGQLLGTPNPDCVLKGSLDVHSIPMAARLRSSSAVLPFLSNRLENLRKLGIQRGALGGELLKTWGFGREEVEDMGETLAKMVRALDPASDTSSDSD
ncbi:hypothetical protein KSS87_006044 [Heliosperma pusillum]|nr:hypothetical protein KSS87_006044 [Heliosperma pusillum]